MAGRSRVLGLLSLLAFGCGSNAGGNDATSGTDGAPTQFRVATYNAGLAFGFVDHTDERAGPVAQALAEQDLDVLCVQEVWRDSDWTSVAAASGTALPEALRRPAEPGGDAAVCTTEELDPLHACADQNCADATPEEITGCILEFCGTPLGDVSDPCLGCLIQNVGMGTFDEVRATCESDGTGTGGREPSFAYEGSFGTGLLSRTPLLAADSVVLDSTATRRAVLYGRVDETAIGEVHVFCTHLTATLSNVPYTGAHGSWEAEQALQVDALLDYVASKAPAGAQVVLAGDFNAGPTVGNALPKNVANYDELTEAGFLNPYAADPDAGCTFCSNNPLNDGGFAAGVLIDHVLLRGIGAEGSAAQILREPLTIDVGGESIETAYSDHYGVRVVLE